MSCSASCSKTGIEDERKGFRHGDKEDEGQRLVTDTEYGEAEGEKETNKTLQGERGIRTGKKGEEWEEMGEKNRTVGTCAAEGLLLPW